MPEPAIQRALRFPATIFLSAFLLFQVQPMMARYILPWFGGGPAVWTNCLLFFQVVLLAGYAYAHWLGSRPRWRLQAGVHRRYELHAFAVMSNHVHLLVTPQVTSTKWLGPLKGSPRTRRIESWT